METAPEPAAPGAARASTRGADPAGPKKSGEPRASERGRLRPPPPAPAHAPLLLGLDAEGVEHPQGPDDPDDASLVGRCWGCVCGWRGSVRDVATRHFRPQVGDGGGLRRKRLARADRDARSELEHHLTTTTPPPFASNIPAVAAVPSRAVNPEAGRARRPRRRLTLPRTTTPDGDTSTPAPPPAGEAASVEPPPPAPLPAEEPALKPGTPRPLTEPHATTGPELTTAADAEPRPGGGGRAEGVLDLTVTPAPSAAAAAAASGAGADRGALAAAATRAAAARAELAVAETALDAAVAAARADGASWRTIARATGVPHRDAVARWAPETTGPSL